MGYKGIACVNLDDLCGLLKVPVGEFYYFANNTSLYVYLKKVRKKDGTIRDTYAPKERLKEIQRAIKEVFFENYEYPSYVYGLSGDSLRDHAKNHIGNKELVKIDLRDFFPSIDSARVYKMWVEEFNLPPSVARLLTKIITHKGDLQQGFPTSSHAAAIIAKPLTSQIFNYCSKKGLVFTQYVDDLNFSGIDINYKNAFKLMIDFASKTNFSVKRKKTRVYNNKTGKIITGVSIYGNRIRAPKTTRSKAANALKELAQDPTNTKNMMSAQGYASYLKHLNKKDGQRYRSKMKEIMNPKALK